MNKKWYNSIFFKIGIFIIFVTSCYFIFGTDTTYVNINWSIKLSKPDKVIYQIDNRGWLADGEEYIVIKYTDRTKIESLDSNFKWMDVKNIKVESRVNEILKKLKTSDENKIDFNIKYVYYTSQKQDNSKIYLIYQKEENKLYVIEDFM